MIAANDAANISRLLKQLSRDSSTENIIAFFADNGGMLQSCKKILAFCRDGNEEAKEWLQKECGEHGVQYAYFLKEAGRVLRLFLSDDEKQDNYETLGLSSTASLDEVKRAYRKLSARYHPDTAGNAGGDTTEQFIQINKAYHAITNRNQGSDRNLSGGASSSWHYGNTKKASGSAIKKTILWISILILLAVGASIVVSQVYSRKVMLTTLHQNSAAFVPPSKKNQENAPAEAMTFAEKMKIAESMEKEREATRQQEATASDDSVTVNVSQPEQKVVKIELPEKKEEKVATLPKVPVRMAAVEVVPVDTPRNASPVVPATKQVTALPSPEIKDETGKVKTAPDDEEATKRSRGDSGKKAELQNLKEEDYFKKQELAVHYPEQDDQSIKVVAANDVSPKDMEQQPVAATLPGIEIPEKETPVLPDMQERVDKFLLEYCRAYSDKNLMAFTRFFELDATENGKPVVDLMDTYAKLFESTKEIALRISTLKWEESPKGITLDGRFKIDLVYQNAEVVHGRGKIDFLLINDHGKLQVSKMNYSFDQ